MTKEKPRHDIENYNETLQERTKKLREIAEEAKEHGEDPSSQVEIDQADDIAERCEMLLREEIDGLDGLQEKIRHYEENTDLDREEISFAVSDDLVEGEIGSNLDERERVEAAVRSAIAILTEGVVAAPIEGIGEVTIEENDDGTDYIRIHYNGPIRSAGGTGQALSVLVADHVRQELGMAPFKPRDIEVERYKEEIKLYDDDTGLQYMPKDKEIKTIIKHCPVMLDGMQTVEKEVSGYRDLERIDGNRPRGGVCLVAAEGLAQKAPKMKRIVDGNNIEGWDWLTELSTVTTTDDDDGGDEEETEEDEEEEEIDYDEHRTQDLIEPDSIDHPVFEPNKKFQKDITGGRPIFSGPSRRGGLRLRYGRARNTGIASSGFHPATMIATDEFLSTGVQQKTERPGKATGTAPVDGIEGPTVRLEDGTVKQLTTEEEARNHEDEIEYIIDLGEMLVNYGEFLENNHPLAPSPYTPEWWIQDLENAGMPTDSLDPNQVDFETALKMSESWNIPIHPNHTYLFSDITPEDYTELAEKLQTAEEIDHDVYDYEIETNENTNETLEHLLVEHKQHYNEDGEHTTTYIKENDHERLNYYFDADLDTDGLKNGITCVNEAIKHTVMPRVTTRIGSRMGRPEKSDYRAMSPPIHGLFPIGDKGGKGRELYKAANNTDGSNKNVKTGRGNDDYKGQGIANVQLNNRICTNCNETTWKVKCPHCNERTDKIVQCYNCGNIKRPEMEGEKCESCYNGNFVLATRQQLNINEEVNDAMDRLGETKSRLPKTKAVEGLTSASKVPEPIEKTILRGKYDVYPFRDSTVRYDMVDLPLTSFRIDEVIGLDLETAHDLGYTHDLDGNELEEDDQLTEIYPQDIIVSEECGDYLLQAANYIDQLLEDYYGVDPYYRADSKQDLIGKMVVGLAPHTSAGVMSRLIGFSDSKAQLGHPIFHAAKRRNCFAPDTELSYKINGDWKRTTIEELVETYLTEDANSDEYRVNEVVQSIEDHSEIDELKVPSMTDEGHRTLENVTHLSKHPPKDHLLKITADDGTELEVTGDHKFPVKNTEGDSLTVEKKAHELEEGDELFDYNEDILEEVQNFEEIDLLEELLTSDHEVSLDNVMIRGMNKEQVYDLLIPEVKPKTEGRFYKMKSSCEYLGITKKTLDNYLRRESIPVSLFQDLYESWEDTTQAIIDNIPRNVTLGMNSDNVDTPRMITLDEELATLIGYYTAEGYTREKMDDRVDGDHRGSTHTDFSATEEQTREFIINVLNKKFNLKNPYTNSSERITASGQMIRQFFKTVIEGGNSASDKIVPNIIQKNSENIKRAYLSGYISGDGYFDKSNNTIGMVTISEKLKNNLIDLIKNMGYNYWVNVEQPVSLHKKFPEYYEENTDKKSNKCYYIELPIEDSKELIKEYGMHLTRKNVSTDREFNTSTIENVEFIKNSREVYDITVENTHKLEVNGKLSKNCDGDEDAVFLALDGFLNFSREYLPDAIGRRTMDAPLVVTSVIDPTEIDDEAHMVDVVSQYDRDFYLQSWDMPGPKEVDVEIIEDMLGGEIKNVRHTMETSSVNAGPYSSRYPKLEGMQNKVDRQLALAAKSRSVEEKTVASKVIDKHFFPDIRGNLRAYAQQDFRCTKCETKFRRLPLTGECPECADGGNLIFTVHEGMIRKYMQPTLDIADKYEVDEYVYQQLEEIESELDSIFEMDTEEQTGLDDFM